MDKKRLASMQERRLHFGGDFMISNKPSRFPSNFIKTSKYNIITFLPKSLMLQFQKYANWYFLFTAILQCFPEISTQTPVSAVAPLAFVILLSMLREGMEDIKRHKSDNQMNSSDCTVWKNDKWEKTPWANVKVGDFILTKEEEIISADAIILCSSLSTGQAFIETSSLDGEKNLKPRSSISEIQTLLFNSLNSQQQVTIPSSLLGQITCSMPNPHLHFFEGCIYKNDSGNNEDIELGKGKKLPANIKNLLLRGSRIKNLEWVVGVVVYTGQDTKIMKNADQGKSKLSNIDQKCNTYIIYVMILQMLLCLLVALLNLKTCRETTNLSIYLASETDCQTQFLYTFASYLLLLNTMIPISLVVSLEFIKVGQAYYMEKDKELFSVFNQQPLKVFACTINEELGQIQHIFTDKTGTLTCNKMEFKMLLSGLQTYGDYNILQPNIVQNFERDQHTAQIANRKRMPSYVDHRAGVEYCFHDKTLEILIQSQKDNSEKLNQKINFISAKGESLYELSTEKQLAQELLLLLSTCHECVLQMNKETGKKSYQGPSPDEIALVDAASRMGYAYSGVDNKELILSILGKEKRVELLHSIEFDSDRKRMSVIVRDNGKVKMYVKGADSIIQSRLSKTVQQPFFESIDKSLEAFSMKGLRTLCLAMKVLSDEEYEVVKSKIEASVGLPNQEKQLKIIGEEIEKDLILLGATAVEDRLQDNVPAVLRDFLKANINVWMLTGDKLETAENIGRSCNLITQNMGVLYIRGANTVDNRIDDILKDYLIELPGLAQDHKDGLAVVVEGESLTWILGDDERKMQFLRIISECKSVVCCRVTPKQKADVVKLVKEKLNKITLAIGDGANDVNMIQEAHIGVGIYGNEGMRAVQASDYAMGQFQFLWKLVLYHGRLNYIRISECILYFFYKNFVFTFPQLFFSFYSNYSGQSIFDDWYITFYNCIFTFWPVVIKSVYEEDIYYRKKKNLDGTNEKEEKLVLSKIANEDNDVIQKFYPKLYYIGQANRIFQFQRFSKWVMLGIVQGALCFFLHIYSYSQGVIDDAGDTTDIWVMSISLYTAIIILVNLKLALNTQMWTIWNWVGFIFTSIGSYFGYIWISDILPMFAVYLTADMLFKSSKFYFTVILTILICFSFDFLLLTAKNQKESLLNYFKKATRKQQEVELNRVEELQDKLNKELKEMQSFRKHRGGKSQLSSISSTSPSKSPSFSSSRSSQKSIDDSRLKNPSLYTSFTVAEDPRVHDSKSNCDLDILEKSEKKNVKETLISKDQNPNGNSSKPYYMDKATDLDLSTEEHSASQQSFLGNEHL